MQKNDRRTNLIHSSIKSFSIYLQAFINIMTTRSAGPVACSPTYAGTSRAAWKQAPRTEPATIAAVQRRSAGSVPRWSRANPSAATRNPGNAYGAKLVASTNQ